MRCEIQRPTGARKKTVSRDAEYRADFVLVLSHLGLEHGAVVALAERYTGRPFETCSPAHLSPLLQEVAALVRARSSGADGSRGCRG
jgi:hypothetical protein